jgi:hypothetical protein
MVTLDSRRQIHPVGGGLSPAKIANRLVENAWRIDRAVSR